MIVLVAVCGVVCVLAGVMALLATRLERMAVALIVIGVAEAALVVALQPTTTTALPVVAVLVLGAVAMTAVVLGAMAVLEVDARPTRQLRPWKVLLLLPLVVLAVRLAPDLTAAATTTSPKTPSTDHRPLALTFMTIGAAAVAVPLLARRREAT